MRFGADTYWLPFMKGMSAGWNLAEISGSASSRPLTLYDKLSEMLIAVRIRNKINLNHLSLATED